MKKEKTTEQALVLTLSVCYIYCISIVFISLQTDRPVKLWNPPSHP